MRVETERITDFPLPDTSHGRSVGVHQSDIIRCIATEAKILKPEWCDEINLLAKKDMSKIGIVAQLRICLGLAWENFYIPTIPNVEDHPGEMCVDGIYMTHDGEELCVIITPIKQRIYLPKIHEVKCTYKSTRTMKDIGAQFMWMSQIKGYCKGAGTLIADLHRLHVCGDYSYPISPILEIDHLEFTEDEIEDNWELLRDYRNNRLIIEGAL